MRLALPRWFASAASATLLLQACDPSRPFSSDEPHPNEPRAIPAASTASLSSYFPPSEAAGGWRTTTDVARIGSLGIDAGKLAGLGSYLMSQPYESYNTGVSGYSASNKAAIVVKKGWIVGEYYNQASAATGVYYLASNGKTFAMLLAGRMARDYPELGLGLNSRLYDQRWLPQGFPVTDARKAEITFDEVFGHTSGIIPEVEDPIASSAVRPDANWNFVPTTVGKDPDYPVTAPLYFEPGNPSTYTVGSTYSSVAFNHFSVIFRNVTELEPSVYLRQAILNPIGVGRMAYKLTTGMGDYVWATAGNGLTGARDFARLGYLMLHEGDWAGTEIFEAEWLRQFTTSPAYRNIRSNVDCRWGNKFPSDMYRTTGSGQNWALVVPSLDLVLTFNGRTPKSRAADIDSTSLNRLFAAVTERYVACDGTVFNDTPPPSNTPPSASFSADCSGADCAFTDASSDPDGTVAIWTWTFGDGGTSTQQNPRHTYSGGGSFTVVLTVTDGGGATSSASRSVTITAPPAISLTATGKEDATKQYMMLRWSGATGATVDIYRNGTFLRNTPNDGRQTVTRNNYTGPATYVLKICQAGTSACSNEVTLVFQ